MVSRFDLRMWRKLMLKVGVIGLGVGEAHVRAFDRHPQCKVVRVADL